MVVLLGVVLGLGLLFLWLSGHWFGRALVFIGCLAFAGLLLAVSGKIEPLGWLILLGVVVVGWFIAAAPSWFRRRQMVAR